MVFSVMWVLKNRRFASETFPVDIETELDHDAATSYGQDCNVKSFSNLGNKS